MAFFDKLNDLAKNVGDKANDAIETTKLHSKINGEKTEIANLCRQIGEYYCAKYAAGDCPDPEVSPLIAAVGTHKATIAEAEAQIRELKEETPAASTVSPPAADGIYCTACGEKNGEGTKFCRNCGNKL
ncbi:MAG: zinc ribbon domain-containing protein [Clostridia bacterium]|nr:zinc ribbon domain-containing protein [Clostridia bacterium]